MNHAVVALAALSGIVLVSCARQSQQTQEVARVDNQTLTLDAIYRQLDTTNGISEAQVRMFARQWVNSELLFQEAKRLGLDNSEAVQKNLDDAKRQLTVNALLEKEIFNDTPQSVSKEEVAIYFRNHQEEFILRNDIVYLSLAIFSEREPAAAFREAALQGDGWKAALGEFQNPKDNASAMITTTDSVFYTQATLFPSKLWKVASALGTNEVSFPGKNQRRLLCVALPGKLPARSNATPRICRQRDSGQACYGETATAFCGIPGRAPEKTHRSN